VLHDIERKQVYKSITQMTPIPLDVVADVKTSTPADYEHLKTGFSTTVGSVMAKKLDVSTKTKDTAGLAGKLAKFPQFSIQLNVGNHVNPFQ
jgi:hypothetical protein